MQVNNNSQLNSLQQYRQNMQTQDLSKKREDARLQDNREQMKQQELLQKQQENQFKGLNGEGSMMDLRV